MAKTIITIDKTTFEEQAASLSERNLAIHDVNKAVNTLRRISYHRLSAYFKPFLKHGKQFKEGASFEEIVGIYEFDKRLRQLILGLLESVEIALRTHLSYFLSQKYGPLGYEDSSHFQNQAYHKSFLNQHYSVLRRNEELARINKHTSHFPIWEALELTSFGTLSKLYSNLKAEDKKALEKEFYNLPSGYLESWLSHLSYVRNICAHYGRLYNKPLVRKPRLFRKERQQFTNSRIFVSLFILKKLVPREEWDGFFAELEALMEGQAYEMDLKLAGFPENWLGILQK